MFAIIFSIFMLLFAGICFYVSKMLHSGLTYFFANLSFWWVFGIFTAVTLTAFAVMMLHTSFLEAFFSVWVGVFIYILLFTLLSDLVRVILVIFKSGILSHKLYSTVSCACVVALTLLTVIYGIFNARNIKIASYEIELESSNVSEVHLALISDLHLGAVGSESRLEDIVDGINALKPDIICIAGDFFDTDFGAVDDPQKAIKELKRLIAPLGVYACVGNHDAGKTFDKMKVFLEMCNIRLLCDEHEVIDGKFTLVGRLDRHSIGGYGALSRCDTSLILEKIPSDLPAVILDHNPSNVVDYSSPNSLILSGHTHRGQIFPGSLITSQMFEPDYGYLKKDDNSPHIVVSSGIGYWDIPLRVGTDSEIVSIKLVLS